MARVIGLGAGGHAKVVIDALRLAGGHELLGFLDADRNQWNRTVLGVRVLGGDDWLPRLLADGVTHAFIGVGAVGQGSPRPRLYRLLCDAGMKPLSVIHPRATVSPHARIGAGPTILAGAVVNADARLGDDVIVNTAAVVEHDCDIGHHAHIATGARLSGGVAVGDEALVGVGASVRQGIRIGARAVVGAGAVVVDDVPNGAIVVGVPARPLATKTTVAP